MKQKTIIEIEDMAIEKSLAMAKGIPALAEVNELMTMLLREAVRFSTEGLRKEGHLSETPSPQEKPWVKPIPEEKEENPFEAITDLLTKDNNLIAAVTLLSSIITAKKTK